MNHTSQEGVETVLLFWSLFGHCKTLPLLQEGRGGNSPILVHQLDVSGN